MSLRFAQSLRNTRQIKEAVMLDVINSARYEILVRYSQLHD